MKLTNKTLVAHGRNEFVEFLAHHYPEGEELSIIFQNPACPIDLLHWASNWLDLTEEEKEAYTKACCIEDSTDIWQCYNVKSSSRVVFSKDIDKSSFVFKSQEVVGGRNIVSSEGVYFSNDVFMSFFVDGCSKIWKCSNANASYNISNSKSITTSKNVANSSAVFDSREITNCSNIYGSLFCANSKELKNCMFCNGLEHASYHIFNKPVEKQYFELFAQQYRKYAPDLLSFVNYFPGELYGSLPSVNNRIDVWYSSLSEKFLKWAKTLPNFDPMILYNITLLPDILK